MGARYRMHIAALVQQNDQALFRKIQHEYAREHSKGVAQYMADTLPFWADGRVEIQSSSLDRFSSFAFPEVSTNEIQPLIKALYQQYRANYPETYHLSFRIDHNIDESVEYLNRIVENFALEDYDLNLSSDFCDGTAWVCQDDLDRAQSILRRYTRPVGEANYSSVRPAVNEFLSKLKNDRLPIPFEQRFELAHGYITVDYKHRLRKRIGDAFKNFGKKILPFWK